MHTDLFNLSVVRAELVEGFELIVTLWVVVVVAYFLIPALWRTLR